MKLRILDNGQILKNSPELNLPNFIVLTGENGSGKTQLLKWISTNRMAPIEGENTGFYMPLVKKDDGTQFDNIVYLRPGISTTFNNYINSSERLSSMRTEWEQLKFIVELCKHLKYVTLENFRKEIENVNNLISIIANNSKIKVVNSHLIENTGSIATRHVELHELGRVLQLIKKSGKDAEELTFKDFIIFEEIPPNLFTPNIDLLFHQYELKKIYYPKLVEHIVSPLELMNQIFESAGFKYQIAFDYSDNESIINPVDLLDKSSGKRITFESLSSGEKTILSLTFTLYNSSVNGFFPDLMMFDEPDAFLHPSMVKLYLNVVNEVLVEKNNVAVIMTTHSPTTVAMAPEDSIFEMNRHRGYPNKIERGNAINSLIYGIHGLFVSNEKRRQVFVESDYDVEYYEGIYKQLKKRLSQEIQLNFISSGKTKVDPNGDEIATCERVKTITKEMRTYNNKQIFGIIDWDLKNRVRDGITILGNGKRYSIENYLLDPILIGLMLQRESHLTFEQMGILDKTYGQLLSFTQEDYQKISDFIITEISDLKSNVITCNHTDIEEYELINGVKIKIPKWFLYYQGHRLENDLIVKFPKLGELKRSKETGLKLAIINKLLKDNPEIMSKDFLTMFEFLHSN